jgi:hypothetical protein
VKLLEVNMSTFREANQARLVLKMKLSNYAWYGSSVVVTDNDGFSVVVGVKKIDNQVRKVISPVVDGVSVKTELETRKK